MSRLFGVEAVEKIKEEKFDDVRWAYNGTIEGSNFGVVCDGAGTYVCTAKTAKEIEQKTGLQIASSSVSTSKVKNRFNKVKKEADLWPVFWSEKSYGIEHGRRSTIIYKNSENN